MVSLIVNMGGFIPSRQPWERDRDHSKPRRFRYDPTLTLGNVLQVIVIILGVIAAYVRIQGTLDRHDAQISSTARTVETLSTTQSDMAQNLKVLTAIVNERTHPVQ